MIRIALAAICLTLPFQAVLAAESSEKPDPATLQLAQFDKLVSRYKKAYSDTSRLIQSGPKVMVSTSAAKLPEAQERLRLAEELVRRDKQALAEAPKLSSSAAVTPTPEIDAASCAKTFSYGKMLSSYGSDWTVDQITQSQDFLFNVVMYQVCSDVASKSGEMCAAQSGLFDVRPKTSGPEKPDHSDHFSYGDQCRNGAANARMIMAAAAGADAFKAECEKTLVDVFAPGKAAAGCAAAAASLDDPKAAAARIKPMLKNQAEPEAKLEGDLAMLTGRAPVSSCAAKKADGFGVNAEICLAGAAYRKARAAGAPACGASALCRAFMGGGQAACQTYASQVRTLYCRRGLIGVNGAKPAQGADRNEKLARERQTMMSKLKSDEDTLARQRAFVEALTAASGGSARESEFIAAVSARRKELRGMLDEAFQLIDSIEPKSHAGIAERREVIDDLQQDFDNLAVASPSAPAHRPKRKKKATAAE